MLTLLKITSSLSGQNSQSTQLANQFVHRWLIEHPTGRVITRDLSAEALPHLTLDRFQALGGKDGLTPDQQTALETSDKLVEELKAADVIVLAVPMYNFNVPSTLRSYFDHIARMGVTFRYTAAGPEGLLQGKRTYVFVTRGGYYAAPVDTQIPYLRQFLNFIGITDIEFVIAEGLAISEKTREDSLAAAREAIVRLTPESRVA